MVTNVSPTISVKSVPERNTTTESVQSTLTSTSNLIIALTTTSIGILVTLLVIMLVVVIIVVPFKVKKSQAVPASSNTVINGIELDQGFENRAVSSNNHRLNHTTNFLFLQYMNSLPDYDTVYDNDASTSMNTNTVEYKAVLQSQSEMEEFRNRVVCTLSVK